MNNAEYITLGILIAALLVCAVLVFREKSFD